MADEVTQQVMQMLAEMDDLETQHVIQEHRERLGMDKQDVHAHLATKIAEKVLADEARKKKTPEPPALVQSLGDAIRILEQLSESADERLTTVEHQALGIVLEWADDFINDRELT